MKLRFPFKDSFGEVSSDTWGHELLSFSSTKDRGHLNGPECCQSRTKQLRFPCKHWRVQSEIFRGHRIFRLSGTAKLEVSSLVGFCSLLPVVAELLYWLRTAFASAGTWTSAAASCWTLFITNFTALVVNLPHWSCLGTQHHMTFSSQTAI